MQHLIINEKEVDLPESWAEVTWKQGCELVELAEREGIDQRRYIFYVVSICTGFPPKFWEQFTDLPQFQAIANGLSWAFRQDLATAEVERMKNKPWRKLEYQGEPYEMPKDIGQMTAAQYIDASAVAQNLMLPEHPKEREKAQEITTNEILSSKRHLFCIYFQGVIDGEYDYSKALTLNIDDIPFVKVIRWSDFFLISLIGSTNGTVQKRRKYLGLRKRLKRVFPSLGKSGDGY